MKARTGVPSLLLGSLLVAPVGYVADKSAIDADFLEFLGSIDVGEDGWGEYLEGTDLEKIIKAPVKPPQSRPPPPPTAATQPPASKAPVKEPVKEPAKTPAKTPARASEKGSGK